MTQGARLVQRLAHAIRIGLLCSLAISLHSALGGGSPGATVVLLWDLSTDPAVKGYNVHYGVASGNYTNVLSVDNASQLTVSNLVPGVTYYFASTTHDVLGLESDFSNELSYSVPASPVLVVTADDQSRVYGTANGVMTGSLTGVQAGDDITASYTTTADAGSGVGTYPIVPVINDPAGKLTNYTVSVTNGVLTVIPAPLTMQVDNQSRLYGQANPAFTATYNGFMNGDTANSLTSQATLSTTATAASPVGNYPITASGAAGANYTVTYIPGTLLVTKASTMAALSSSGNPSLPGQPVTLSLALGAVAPGAGTPTGTVQFRIDGLSAGGPVSLIGGTASYTTTTLAHGAHTVTCEYAGDTNFSAVTNALSPAQVINTPPVAGPVTIERGLTNVVKISIADLLTNDSDADGDSITLTGVNTTSANGGAVVTNSGWIFYTPAPGFTNADTFTYAISDGWGASVTGVVTVSMSTDGGPSRNLAISNLGTGSFAIRGRGVPGQTYLIQYTSNWPPALNWQTLGTVTADDSGSFMLVDAAGPSLRFYRAVYPLRKVKSAGWPAKPVEPFLQ